MEYKAIYKCRLCGAVFHTITATEELAQDTVEEFTNAYHGTAPLPCWPTETHRCGGDHAGSLGLADFLGWNLDASVEHNMGEHEDKTESGLLEEY